MDLSVRKGGIAMKKYLRPEMELTKLSALSVLASSIEDNVYDDGDFFDTLPDLGLWLI